MRQQPVLLYSGLMFVALLVAGPVMAQMNAQNCAELQSLIGQLNQQISNDTIASSRQLREQQRNNYINAYNANCLGGGRSSGGFTGGASSNPYATMYNILQGARDLLNQQDAQRQQLEQQRRQQEALDAQQREYEAQRRIEAYMRSEREKEESARRRQAEEQRRGDDQRTSYSNAVNPFAAPQNTSGGSRVDVGAGMAITGNGPIGNQGVIRPAAPGAATGSAKPPPETDREIREFCQSAPNPQACISAQTEARNRGIGQYSESQRRYWAERARQQRAGTQGEANPPTVITVVPSEGGPATRLGAPIIIPSPTAPATGMPNTPSASAPTVSTSTPTTPPVTVPQSVAVDADLARCREGASEPWTVVSCYEEVRARQGRPPLSAREKLRLKILASKSLIGQGRASGGGAALPGGDTDALETLEDDPAGDVVVEVAHDPYAPPPNHTRMEHVTQSHCERWKGRYLTDRRGIPVCDFPDFRFTLSGSATDASVRETVREMTEALR